ncbi:MAG: hypothetical protein QOJ64_18, partial [Acidobacteriota bacterium]|nr:hypothetical protein [Acidobacteriota bacterium]
RARRGRRVIGNGTSLLRERLVPLFARRPGGVLLALGWGRRRLRRLRSCHGDNTKKQARKRDPPRGSLNNIRQHQVGELLDYVTASKTRAYNRIAGNSRRFESLSYYVRPKLSVSKMKPFEVTAQ